jgi:predicted TIM-barrel fold metal-dependent hydrolase
MLGTDAATRRATIRISENGLVDADVHAVVPSTEALFPYLSAHWRDHVTNTLMKGVVETAYPRYAPTTAHSGLEQPNLPPAGSSLEAVQRDVFDRDGAEIAVLCCTYQVDSLHNPDAAVAFAQAANDWLAAEWLDRDPRLRAGILVPVHYPELAAREIDRVGAHPGFVQANLPARTTYPLGSRINAPIWDAIARNRLVGAIHFGGAPGTPPTPSGWSSYYIEDYVGMAHVVQSQVVSLITEGTLDLHPEVNIAVLEAGFTWIGPFLWRFDKEWRNLRRLVPWVRRPPSEYLRERFRFTIQPLDAPDRDDHFAQAIDQIGSDDVLMYSSDYPHRHVSGPSRLLELVTPFQASRIRSGNARALYRLE